MTRSGERAIQSAPGVVDQSVANAAEAIPTPIVRSLAGATDFGDLIRRIASWLELERHPDASVRFWLFDNGRAEPLIRHPPGVELPPIPGHILSRAASGPFMHDEGADFVSLLSEKETIGILEIRPHGAADVVLLAHIAAVAAARIGGLVTAQHQRERLPHVPATDNAHEIQGVISGFAAQAKGLLDHDRLSIYLLTPDGAALERFAVATSPVIPGEGDIMPLEQVGLTRVVKTNEPLVSADFGEDDRILGLEDSIIARAGFHGLVSVPLRMGGKPFGILNFVSKTRNYYSEDDIPVAQQIADEASVFLQNLRLQHGIRAAVEREAIARERNRVAQEFHDTLAQALSVIASRATALTEDPHLSDSESAQGHATVIRDLSLNALEEARRSLQNMLPSQLEDASLAEAIEHALAELRDEQGLSTSVVVEGNIDVLPKSSQATIFRIVSEAITNVRRHAEASSVVVQLTEASSEIRMSILDNGKGMQPASLHGVESGGFGLETMRERAEALGGRLVVSSASESGTEILLNVPVSRRVPKPRPNSRRPATESVGVTRVLVIDDHPTFREGIRQLLAQAPGVRLVGEARTGAEGLAMVVARQPDVVLLDLDLPDRSGIELARRLRSAAPGAAVVIVSAFAESDNISDALHAGARGYVAKSVSPNTILDAIRTAMDGGTLLPSGFLSDSINGQETLTPRELEILKWIALGKTNADIGRELHLADKTIERVVANVTRKLGAKNRTHAVAKGIARNLVDVRHV